MDIEDYEPISTLRVDQNLITKSKYPFIDVHNHQFDMPIKDLSKLVLEMDSMNMGFMVNLSGFRGLYLENSLKNIDHKDQPNRHIYKRFQWHKIHLFDVMLDDGSGESYRESKTFESGNDIVVAQTEIGNIGLSVCYDLRFPEMYRKMHNKNVQIITAPSAFTATTGKAHWETLLKTRAIENLCYLIASNQGGVHANGRETWGHSMIVDPWGEILAEVKEETGIAIAKIDIEKQTNLRKRFPVLTHRKLD